MEDLSRLEDEGGIAADIIPASPELHSQTSNTTTHNVVPSDPPTGRGRAAGPEARVEMGIAANLLVSCSVVLWRGIIWL